MAITIKKLAPISVQATVFTPGLTFLQSKVLSFVLSELGDRLDGTPVSLPDADGLPPPVPRVIVSSSDNQYKLEASPGRLNLYCLKTNDSQRVSLSEFYEFAVKSCIGYIRTTSAKVGRLAGVLTRAAKVQDPAAEISGRFCKADYVASVFRGAETFELHNHKRYKLSDRFNVNSWVRWKCGFEGPREKNQRVIVVEQDINTLGEELESQEYSDEEITSYFGIVQSEFDSILSLYIPKE